MKRKPIFVLTTLALIKTSQMFGYEPGTHLLGCRNGEEVRWGQSKNYKNGCHPSYNYFCPGDLDDEDQCNYTLAGCAAVAMAQIMYKWGYPEKSKYNSYNWDRIPPVLTDGCSDDCPQLIRDCGTACNIPHTT